MANAGSVITSLKLRISSPGAESIYCTAQSGGETSSRDTYAPIPMCSAQDVSKPYKTESVRETLHNHSRSTQWDPLRTSWDDVLSSTQKDVSILDTSLNLLLKIRKDTNAERAATR